MSEPDTLPNVRDTAAESAFVRGVRQDLDRGCAALDGHTLSRLNRIRHTALERHQGARRRSPLLLPFGGLVTAGMLVFSVMLSDSIMPPTAVPAGGASPMEDLDILTFTEDLDFYENYEFYQWLADNGSTL
ncbi:MAG TPA: hypothetical protein VNR18_14505 [Hyphomicrobiales bacterium]|nr:hypothetical protein [Hyphomicrobiales bacterium]